MEQLVEHFGSLDVLLAATPENLAEVEGMSERRADELHMAISAAASSARRKSFGARRV
jgi:DNA integrity scanning protein DisA with diadenylate cyclase activity